MNTAAHVKPSFRGTSVTNAKTGALYQMVPASHVESTEPQIENLVSTCNQPLIYNFIFKEPLGGSPYTADNARHFFTWAKSGWENGTYFVFALVDPAGLIAGVLDIKSNDRSRAEIGYWCSDDHKGLMTNAVAELVAFARANRFAGLWARVKPHNDGSKRVLEKNGFERTGECASHPDHVQYDLRF
jgi:RimJ/RimL family protein N-acetyltransferase